MGRGSPHNPPPRRPRYRRRLQSTALHGLPALSHPSNLWRGPPGCPVGRPAPSGGEHSAGCWRGDPQHAWVTPQGRNAGRPGTRPGPGRWASGRLSRAHSERSERSCRRAGADGVGRVGSAAPPCGRVARHLLRYLGGEGLGKVCVCCWRSAGWEARAGAAVLPLGFREAVGAAHCDRRGRLPAGGGRSGAGRGGRARGAGAHVRRAPGSRLARRAEQARGPARSADSGAAGAGGGGGGAAAGKEGRVAPAAEHGAPGAEAAAPGAPVAG